MKQIQFFSIGLLAIFLSCAPGKQTTVPTTPLYETRWSLKKIHTETGIEEVNTKAFIKFDQEKKSAGGNGSCNSFGSNAVINNNEVKFTNIFSTKMFCEAVQKTENAFLGNLEKVNRFEIKDKNLLLYRDNELLLELTAV